ncbi:mevalonate kinase [Methanocaldococcus infernus ME]|uniref:Mevalonate kinase n=1 Tax=Methanocaldococcus infernus (strain DSM 11812 / JCM 15783 / ME) TaxID=573063 RepID=D5VU89_METIM|nr:mevalonate kinase [Methanocaldococcus infernus]ADG12701.1 mevalonate kinase [Methanocaldococcus infernus ME]
MKAKGKVIFFGEHAVVYGYTALSLPINLSTNVNIKKNDNLVIELKNLNKKLGFEEAKKDKDFRYVIKAIELLKVKEPFFLSVSSELPVSCGLGSSASVVVATIRALSKFFNLNLPKKEIAKLSHRVEREVQGKASITDTYTISYERALKIRNNEFSFIDEFEKTVREEKLYIAYVEEREMKTADLIKVVSEKEEKEEIFKEIEEITREALSSDVERIKELMLENHKLLDKLGVSTKGLNRVVRLAKKFGCGAKLTGAGGGGCVIILGDLNEEEKELIEKIVKSLYLA